MRAMPAAQQLDDMAQAAMVQWLRIVRIDRILDLRKLLDVGAACEERQPVDRSEARRVGKECVRTCRSRWSQYHSKNKNYKLQLYSHTVKDHETSTIVSRT